MNNITLIGNLCKDIDFKYTEKGTAMATCTLAVKRTFSTEQQDTDFVYIQMFGKQAENTANYCKKGSKVGINGELRIDNYEKDGEKQAFTKVLVRSIEFLTPKSASNTETGEAGTVVEDAGFQSIDDSDIPF